MNSCTEGMNHFAQTTPIHQFLHEGTFDKQLHSVFTVLEKLNISLVTNHGIKWSSIELPTATVSVNTWKIEESFRD